MAKGYRPVDRDQPFLLPPDMREWLPGDHPVWLVIRVVGEHLDTSAFHARRRTGGRGAPSRIAGLGDEQVGAALGAPHLEPRRRDAFLVDLVGSFTTVALDLDHAQLNPRRSAAIGVCSPRAAAKAARASASSFVIRAMTPSMNGRLKATTSSVKAGF